MQRPVSRDQQQHRGVPRRRNELRDARAEGRRARHLPGGDRPAGGVAAPAYGGSYRGERELRAADRGWRLAANPRAAHARWRHHDPRNRHHRGEAARDGPRDPDRWSAGRGELLRGCGAFADGRTGLSLCRDRPVDRWRQTYPAPCLLRRRDCAAVRAVRHRGNAVRACRGACRISRRSSMALRCRIPENRWRAIARRSASSATS